MVYKDTDNKLVYLDLRTGKPFDRFSTPAIGRYTAEIADMICDSIRSGTSLTKTCQQHNIPQALFYGWLAIFPEFKKRYAEARKQRADYHFHMVVDLAEGAVKRTPEGHTIYLDKDDIPALKLAIDTHKWAAEKSDPERFAKPKEEGNNGLGSITINLTTGVLDKPAPKDIVVDQYGTFKGFEDEIKSSEPRECERSPETIELSKDRFAITHDNGEREEGTGGFEESI